MTVVCVIEDKTAVVVVASYRSVSGLTRLNLSASCGAKGLN